MTRCVVKPPASPHLKSRKKPPLQLLNDQQMKQIMNAGCQQQFATYAVTRACVQNKVLAADAITASNKSKLQML